MSTQLTDPQVKAIAQLLLSLPYAKQRETTGPEGPSRSQVSINQHRVPSKTTAMKTPEAKGIFHDVTAT